MDTETFQTFPWDVRCRCSLCVCQSHWQRDGVCTRLCSWLRCSHYTSVSSMHIERHLFFSLPVTKMPLCLWVHVTLTWPSCLLILVKTLCPLCLLLTYDVTLTWPNSSEEREEIVYFMPVTHTDRVVSSVLVSSYVCCISSNSLKLTVVWGNSDSKCPTRYEISWHTL